jgi:hypothetical protein
MTRLQFASLLWGFHLDCSSSWTCTAREAYSSESTCSVRLGVFPTAIACAPSLTLTVTVSAIWNLGTLSYKEMLVFVYNLYDEGGHDEPEIAVANGC